MAKFNQNKTGTATKNLAGGRAYSESPQLELASLLLTSFAEDSFYRNQRQTFDRLKELLILNDPEFSAKAAVYARTEFGMRSITHVLASELAKLLGGKKYAKEFYDRIIYRPDDITEILSYHIGKGYKVTNGMKKGFADALNRFSEYSLAKYRGEGKGMKLVDAFNLIHPKPTEKNDKTFKLLMTGELRSTDTWETMLSAAGSDKEKKAEVWASLIAERKIGYFALLRNLRNILDQSPDSVSEACKMLVDEKFIRGSLVLPFRYQTAMQEIMKLGSNKNSRLVMSAISDAMDISLSNVPRFEGDTLVVLDVSGSMSGRPAEIGSLFAAIMMKAANADFMKFSNSATYQSVNHNDSTSTIAANIKFAAGGTNFTDIFRKANKKYDRVIILSDMQGWIQDSQLKGMFSEYKTRYDANPILYSFDLKGYGTLQFPQSNVYCLAGFSEKVFNIMHLLEQDKNALINTINNVEL